MRDAAQSLKEENRDLEVSSHHETISLANKCSFGYHIEKDNENEDEAETLSPDPKPRPAEGAAIQSTAVRKPGKCGSLLSG